jgi:hypothetical protein
MGEAGAGPAVILQARTPAPGKTGTSAYYHPYHYWYITATCRSTAPGLTGVHPRLAFFWGAVGPAVAAAAGTSCDAPGMHARPR